VACIARTAPCPRNHPRFHRSSRLVRRTFSGCKDPDRTCCVPRPHRRRWRSRRSPEWCRSRPGPGRIRLVAPCKFLECSWPANCQRPAKRRGPAKHRRPTRLDRVGPRLPMRESRRNHTPRPPRNGLPPRPRSRRAPSRLADGKPRGTDPASLKDGRRSRKTTHAFAIAFSRRRMVVNTRLPSFGREIGKRPYRLASAVTSQSGWHQILKCRAPRRIIFMTSMGRLS
jgi:hypothetical protein